jgi:hypothetical protein
VDIKPKETVASSPETAPTGAGVDIGQALSYLTADPRWMSKVLVIGLVSLVPILGYVVLLGWMREVFERVKAGQKELPDLDFGNQLSKGLAPLVALVSPMLIIMMVSFILQLLVIPFGIVAGALGDTDAAAVVNILGGLLGMGVMFVWFFMMFVLVLVMPELLRRGMRGEMMPILSPRASIVAIKNNALGFVMVLLGGFVFNLISQLGVFLCFVGMFLTMPLAIVGMSHLLAQWDRLVGDPQAG